MTPKIINLTPKGTEYTMKNVTALKVKFLGATNTKPARASITQTNNNQRMVWTPCSMSQLDYSEQIESMMQRLSEGVGGTVVCLVDNTQTNTSVFVFDCKNPSFPDLIGKIKDFEQR